jgi:hypothetical protein
MSEEQGKLPENVGAVPEFLPTSSADFRSLERTQIIPKVSLAVSALVIGTFLIMKGKALSNKGCLYWEQG